MRGILAKGGDQIAIALVAIVTVAIRAVWWGDPVAGFDEQLYSFIGWRLSEGEVPYVDWWDRKPVGLFVIFGLAHRILGPEPIAYQLVATLFAVASAILVYTLARRLVGSFSAGAAAVISSALLSAFGSHSGQSEVFFLPLMLGMAVLLIDAEHPNFSRRAIWAMLLGGMALQVKYTVLPQCLFFGLYALWIHHRRGASLGHIAGQAAIYALLGLLPTIAAGAVYAVIGEFDAFVFANFLSFFDRTVAPQGRLPSDHWLAIVPIVLLLVAGIYAALRLHRPAPFRDWLFLVGWGTSTFASVLLPGTIYLYYYAALSAPTALIAIPLMDRRGPMGALPALAMIGFFAFFLALPNPRGTSLDQRAAMGELARAISPHVGRDTNCLWIWDGPTALYRMTGSCVPTRYVYPDHLNNALETNALEVDQVEEVIRILANRPGAIVTASWPVTYQNEEATELVLAALEKEYRKSASVDLQGRMITAWIRRDR